MIIKRNSELLGVYRYKQCGATRVFPRTPTDPRTLALLDVGLDIMDSVLEVVDLDLKNSDLDLIALAQSTTVSDLDTMGIMDTTVLDRNTMAVMILDDTDPMAVLVLGTKAMADQVVTGTITVDTLSIALAMESLNSTRLFPEKN